jgi:hypothetical protein
MIVGFTGTRMGMTEGQVAHLRSLLLQLGATGLHHGDCLGADAQAHAVALELKLFITIHPPEDSKYRAFCEGWDYMMAPAPYLARNHDIVRECQHLLVAPKRNEQELRSGTWATWRYAIQLRVPATIIER